MKFFFGAAIQGHSQWGAHASVYEAIIKVIKAHNHTILSDHTTGLSRADTLQKLENNIGSLPTDEYELRVHVRNKMIAMLEDENLSGIIFEVSVPSLGTGVEIAHAYLREKLGLKAVPILLLYKKDFWPNKLSSMVRGVPLDQFPLYSLREYNDLNDLQNLVESFIATCETMESS